MDAVEERNRKCSERVEESFKDRMDDIKILWNAKNNTTELLGSLDEYGLCIDFVEAGTWKDQREPFLPLPVELGRAPRRV
jgi:hypothetical protein